MSEYSMNIKLLSIPVEKYAEYLFFMLSQKIMFTISLGICSINIFLFNEKSIIDELWMFSVVVLIALTSFFVWYGVAILFKTMGVGVSKKSENKILYVIQIVFLVVILQSILESIVSPSYIYDNDIVYNSKNLFVLAGYFAFGNLCFTKKIFCLNPKPEFIFMKKEEPILTNISVVIVCGIIIYNILMYIGSERLKKQLYQGSIIEISQSQLVKNVVGSDFNVTGLVKGNITENKKVGTSNISYYIKGGSGKALINVYGEKSSDQWNIIFLELITAKREAITIKNTRN